MNSTRPVVTQSLNEYFVMHGRDALINGRRLRVIYNDHNVSKRMVARKADHLFRLGDRIKIDTSKYSVIGIIPHINPEVNEARVKLEFF